MKTKLSLLLVLICVSARAQHLPLYHVNPWVTGGIIIGGTAGSIATIGQIQNKPEITDAELNALNRDVINGFDEWALHLPLPDPANSTTYGLVSQAGIAALPLLLFLDENIRRDWKNVLFLLLEVNAVAVSMYELSPLGPLFQNKFRPKVYYTDIPLDQRKAGYNRNSFYSGHVATAAASTFFMAKVYSDYYPDANKTLLYGAAAIPVLFHGYLRLAGLEHFPSDILAGVAIGLVCGVVLPELHRIGDKNVSVGMYSSREGTGISMSVALQ